MPRSDLITPSLHFQKGEPELPAPLPKNTDKRDNSDRINSSTLERKDVRYCTFPESAKCFGIYKMREQYLGYQC